MTNKILACIDDSALNALVCDCAAWVGNTVQAPIQLLHVINHHPELAMQSDLSGNLSADSRKHLLEDLTEQEHKLNRLRLRQGKQTLDISEKLLLNNHVSDIEKSLQHGDLLSSLTALESEFKVVVLGVSGEGHEQHPEKKQSKIGSHVEQILRHLHCPVMLVYPNFTLPKNIMLAYDGGDAAKRALKMILQNKLYDNGNCHLVYVGEQSKGDALFQDMDQALLDASSIEFVQACLPGNPAQSLCAYQLKHDIDMTIMGSFSHTRLHDWVMGSFTAKMLEQTSSSLLLLR